MPLLTQSSRAVHVPHVHAARVTDFRVHRVIETVRQRIVEYGQTVRLDVRVHGTHVRVPSVAVCPHHRFRVVQRRIRPGKGRPFGYQAPARDPPRFRVLVLEYAVPVLAHQHAVQIVRQFQVREYLVHHYFR